MSDNQHRIKLTWDKPGGEQATLWEGSFEWAPKEFLEKNTECMAVLFLSDEDQPLWLLAQGRKVRPLSSLEQQLLYRFAHATSAHYLFPSGDEYGYPKALADPLIAMAECNTLFGFKPSTSYDINATDTQDDSSPTYRIVLALSKELHMFIDSISFRAIGEFNRVKGKNAYEPLPTVNGLSLFDYYDYHSVEELEKGRGITTFDRDEVDEIDLKALAAARRVIEELHEDSYWTPLLKAP